MKDQYTGDVYKLNANKAYSITSSYLKLIEIQPKINVGDLI